MRIKSIILVTILFTKINCVYAKDTIIFATDWKAQAEHGGFYQAMVDETYENYGLDVKIIQGSPESNNLLMLLSKKADFALGSNLLQLFLIKQDRIPIVAIASIFNKDISVLMSHPGEGHDHIEDLKNAPIYLSNSVRATTFKWLEQTYGFNSKNVRNYDFNSAPFIHDLKSVQQGIVTSEPFIIDKIGGFKPNIFMLSDYEYEGYGNIIETREDMIKNRPDVVQRFLSASLIGWKNYLYKNNHAANIAIKKANPEMTDELINYSILQMKSRHLVDNDFEDQNIGKMNTDRINKSYLLYQKLGLITKNIELDAIYINRFIDNAQPFK